MKDSGHPLKHIKMLLDRITRSLVLLDAWHKYFVIKFHLIHSYAFSTTKYFVSHSRKNQKPNFREKCQKSSSKG